VEVCSIKTPLFIFVLFFSLAFCTAQNVSVNPADLKQERLQTISERFAPPEGFKRIPVKAASFSAWLRNLPLLPEDSPVKDYRNRVWKSSADTTVAAVASIDIKGRKLDQCMDILIRFYAEFLWRANRQTEISFPLPDGLMISWQEWEQGLRPQFKGAHFYLEKKAEPDVTSKNFQLYLNTIYEYSSTQVFYHYYRDINPEQLESGDFIVKKGNKGHAVMIVDLAEDKGGNKVALIGQGDTPACQFYLLNYKKGNPWFPLDFKNDILPLPIKKTMFWSGLRKFGDSYSAYQNEKDK